MRVRAVVIESWIIPCFNHSVFPLQLWRSEGDTCKAQRPRCRYMLNCIYNEGPQPRSQKCLFLRPQKQARWKFPCALIIICYQHSYHECRHTHTQREGPWMQGMVFCKKKPPFLDLLRSMSAQHGETYKATFTVSGPWLRMWQWNSDEYSWH